MSNIMANHRNVFHGKGRTAILLLISVAAAVALACIPPISQDPHYHIFADSRVQFGVINGSNVFSNLFFVLAGVAGLWRLFSTGGFQGRYMWALFYGSVILVGFGSAWYHLNPDNNNLVWDRLPMTLAFSSLTACVIFERIDREWGKRLLFPLLAMGVISVYHWWATEMAGAGDLRLYILVQYLPMLLLPLVLMLFSQGREKDLPYWILLVGYALAKVLEWQDGTIFIFSGYLISGHALKHVAAASAIFLFRPVFPNRKEENNFPPPLPSRFSTCGRSTASKQAKQLW